MNQMMWLVRLLIRVLFNRADNELSLLGAVLAIIGFWLYFQILKQDYSAWNMAVIFNVIAIFLYAAGSNWPGVVLSIVCFLYLVQPNVKIHFKK